MGVPQIIIIVLYASSLGMTLAKNGQPKEGEHNFITALIACCIVMGLLWWGGFFK